MKAECESHVPTNTPFLVIVPRTGQVGSGTNVSGGRLMEDSADISNVR